jgi:hypothetical protein
MCEKISSFIFPKNNSINELNDEFLIDNNRKTVKPTMLSLLKNRLGFLLDEEFYERVIEEKYWLENTLG